MYKHGDIHEHGKGFHRNGGVVVVVSCTWSRKSRSLPVEGEIEWAEHNRLTPWWPGWRARFNTCTRWSYNIKVKFTVNKKMTRL